MKVVGVDEAGKGPVLGPMIIAAVLTEYSSKEIKKKPFNLREVEIKDSKRLSEVKRKKIAGKIKEKSKNYFLIDLRAPHIDRLRQGKSMNEIVVESFSRLLSEINFDLAIVDAADVDSKRFGENLKQNLQKDIKIISEHKADEKYPIVSAASILAKNKRDKEIKKIEKNIEQEIGKGYPIDKKTTKFLEDWLNKKEKSPIFCRRTWKTFRDIKKKKDQKNLEDF